jgi:hypothetical protein
MRRVALALTVLGYPVLFAELVLVLAWVAPEQLPAEQPRFACPLVSRAPDPPIP